MKMDPILCYLVDILVIVCGVYVGDGDAVVGCVVCCCNNNGPVDTIETMAI